MSDNILDDFDDHVHPVTSQDKPRSAHRIRAGRKHLLDVKGHADKAGYSLRGRQARVINRFPKPITLASIKA